MRQSNPPALTPSEWIVLRGECFSLANPAEAALAAALLANERGGAISLPVRKVKQLFGLFSSDVLHAERGPNRAAWPEHSLEARVAELANGQPVPVHDVVYTLLAEDSSRPEEHAMDVVRAGLTARGLMETREVKRFLLFTGREYVVPERTQALLEGMPVGEAGPLLADTQRQRPEVWKMLIGQVRGGLNSRTKDDGGSSALDRSD